MLSDFDKIFLRTPIFPYNLLFDGNGKSKDSEVLINEFLNNDIFLEAIYWSSIPFHNFIRKFKNGEIFDEKKIKKLKFSIQKYIIRSCTRTTPYGIFAGVSVFDLNDSQNSLNIKLRHARIDLTVLKKIILAFERDSEFLPYLYFHLNNTIYTVDNQYRFLEITEAHIEKSQISSLEKNAILRLIVSNFKDEKFNFYNFYEIFKNEFEKEELYDFYCELIQSGFLTSELELTLTNSDDFYSLKNFLARNEVASFPKSKRFLKLLKAIDEYTEKLKILPLGDFAESEIERIRNSFNSNGIQLNEDQQIFHVDLLMNVGFNQINKKDIQKILKSVPALNLIVKNHSTEKAETKRFRELFLEKYEGRLVPLMEVLDSDIGIGFPPNSNLGNNTSDFFQSSKSFPKSKLGNDNFSEWIRDKIEDNILCNEITIEDDDIRKHEAACIDTENTKVAYAIAQSLASGKILMENFVMTSPNPILSRFAYLNKDINDLCENLVKQDEEHFSDFITADIIWLPDLKVGNVCRHHTQLDFEIPIFYTSSKEKRHQILLSDIFVTVAGNHIVLLSKKMKKRIVPRLSNAHNYHNSSNSYYRFLGSLQYAHNHNLTINPDFSSSSKRVFPRISYKQIILFSAHWIIQEADLKEILNNENPINLLVEFFKKWRTPQFVTFVNGDNELLIDTLNEGSMELLLNESKNQKKIVLKEWHYSSTYKNINTSQCVIPLINDETIKTSQTAIENRNMVKRSYSPGDEWIYFKIYCSSSFSDIVLKKIDKQILAPFLTKKKIQQFFFIRYLDPHYHLRIRIKVTETSDVGEIIGKLNSTIKKFINKNVVWKFSIDTYEREIERFGFGNIETTETIFFKDSQAFMKLLNKTNNEDIQYRFFLGLKMLDAWLYWAKFTTPEKREFCVKMATGFAKEFPVAFHKEIENKYRNEKEQIYQFLRGTKKSTFLDNLNFNNSLAKNLPDYVHMNINRLFVTEQRTWEYVIYYFCSKYYSRIHHDKNA